MSQLLLGIGLIFIALSMILQLKPKKASEDFDWRHRAYVYSNGELIEFDNGEETKRLKTKSFNIDFLYNAKRHFPKLEDFQEDEWFTGKQNN